MDKKPTGDKEYFWFFVTLNVFLMDQDPPEPLALFFVQYQPNGQEAAKKCYEIADEMFYNKNVGMYYTPDGEPFVIIGASFQKFPKKFATLYDESAEKNAALILKEKREQQVKESSKQAQGNVVPLFPKQIPDTEGDKDPPKDPVTDPSDDPTSDPPKNT